METLIFGMSASQLYSALAIWISGGLFALLVIASKEKARRGLALLDALFYDRELLLIPMIIGYIFTFMFSWISVLIIYMCEDRTKKQ